jgi:hypothetical protein
VTRRATARIVEQPAKLRHLLRSQIRDGVTRKRAQVFRPIFSSFGPRVDSSRVAAPVAQKAFTSRPVLVEDYC